MSALWIVLWLSLFVLVYIYLIFPVFMFFIGRIYKEKATAVSRLLDINIIIPAHNEERVIAQKIENHLSLKYSGSYVITVLCDSCTDTTVDIANKYAISNPDFVRVFEVEGKRGKTTAVNEIMPSIESDVVVFSDANVMLDEFALENINRALQCDRVGGVAGQLSYINAGESGAAESNGLYWKYEEMIKSGEAKYGSLMGADGSIFAIKTQLYRQLPGHVLDDFSTSMGVVSQGYEFKFNESIKAFEKGAEEDAEEFDRKVRISNRSYNSYLNLRKEIISSFGMYDLIKFYSHKVLRWYSFVFMGIAFLLSIILSFLSSVAQLILILQILFYLIAIAHHKNLVPKKAGLFKLSNVIYYFTMANYASMLGILRSIKGEKITVWDKAESTR